MKIILVCLIIFLQIMMGKVVFAQSISDLNTSSFNSLGKKGFKQMPTNPFNEGISTAEDLTLEDLVLVGIATNRSTAYALISGYLVKKEDRIAGFRVDSIEKDKVVLRRLDETYVLTMGGL